MFDYLLTYSDADDIIKQNLGKIKISGITQINFVLCVFC